MTPATVWFMLILGWYDAASSRHFEFLPRPFPTQAACELAARESRFVPGEGMVARPLLKEVRVACVPAPKEQQNG